MDVLQLVKRQHGLIRSLCDAMEAAASVTDKRKAFEQLRGVVEVHFRVESEYLLPEVTAVDPGAGRLANVAVGRHSNILADLKSLDKNIKKRPAIDKAKLESAVSNFCMDVRAHISAVEDEILPRIRQRIPTQEREDLGESLKDVIAEEFQVIGITSEIASMQALAI